MQAIAHRARDIGAIDENQYVSFRIQMTKTKQKAQGQISN